VQRGIQRGQAIVLIAIMLAVVVGMAALAIDGSRAYALRRDLQAALDSAALTAGDRLQQSGSYSSAEQAAATIFGTNLRLYNAPSCAPGFGTPGPAPLTVTCTYSDGTVLTEVVYSLGPQGARFSLTATRSLQLQFARILTNGGNPTIASTAAGGVNNLLFSPALAALSGAGCGGTGGNAMTINGSGTMNVTGDVVSNGTIVVSGAAVQVAGDIYARCQSPVPGSVSNQCYPSGATPPCTYPDVAGATRSGFRFADPNFPAPAVVGGVQSAPNSTVALNAGVYSGIPGFLGGHCWFLGGGVYEWQAGYANGNDFVSNELKPPDEPDPADNTERATHQFWDTNGVSCSGGVQVNVVDGPRGIPVGTWSFVLTSTRTDTYNGLSYPRESAPSMCYSVRVNNSGQNIQITASNVPGATSYNIYAAPPNNGCGGPFGLAEVLPVSVPVLNTNTHPCPAFNGNGCTLGHESVTLDAVDLGAGFAPNALAAPGTTGAYPPNSETTPLNGNLPNQNPPRLGGSAGDRANENNCESTAGAYVSCPGPITPGAVAFYLPNGACFINSNFGDAYTFSGYQYDWMLLYEPGAGSPPANTCPNVLGAAGNSAFVGLVYTPTASVWFTSSSAFEATGMGGVIASTIAFTGTMPVINYKADYAPVPPASRLTG
jgi:hypothetical protein